MSSGKILQPLIESVGICRRHKYFYIKILYEKNKGGVFPASGFSKLLKDS
jgi:hypothetical protein